MPEGLTSPPIAQRAQSRASPRGAGPGAWLRVRLIPAVSQWGSLLRLQLPADSPVAAGAPAPPGSLLFTQADLGFG